MKISKYKVGLIQKDFDNGLSWSEVIIKYNVSKCFLAECVKKDLLSSNKNNKNQWRGNYKFSENTIEKIRNNSLNRKHSEETKQKISKGRIKYLMEHPDKVPYIINHSSKKSWPEEVFENSLKSNNIVGWIYKFQNGIYQYDFAFPEIKLDVEVDGGTHKTEKVKLIDKRRDEFSKNNGWRVLRFEAEKVKKDVTSCINELKEFME